MASCGSLVRSLTCPLTHFTNIQQTAKPKNMAKKVLNFFFQPFFFILLKTSEGRSICPLLSAKQPQPKRFRAFSHTVCGGVIFRSHCHGPTRWETAIGTTLPSRSDTHTLSHRHTHARIQTHAHPVNSLVNKHRYVRAHTWAKSQTRMHTHSPGNGEKKKKKNASVRRLPLAQQLRDTSHKGGGKMVSGAFDPCHTKEKFRKGGRETEGGGERGSKLRPRGCQLFC